MLKWESLVICAFAGVSDKEGEIILRCLKFFVFVGKSNPHVSTEVTENVYVNFDPVLRHTAGQMPVAKEF